jgi:pilus assembly protein CpaB
VFLILALVAGAAATVLIYQLVQGYERRIAAMQKPEETQVVIVAAADLFPGLVITEADIVGIEIPKKYAPVASFSVPDLVVGRVPRERILANEFVLPERLADSESGVGLNALIPLGMRAISININDGNAVSGFLRPGDIVDMLVTMRDDTSRGAATEAQTFTLLQTVPVLAVNDKAQQDENEAAAEAEAAKAKGKTKGAKKKTTQRKQRPSVTFAVTPEQAEEVAHAERLGEITLSLRRKDDAATVESDGGSTKINDVLGEEEKVKEKKKGGKGGGKKTTTEEPGGLKIIRGGKIEERKVGADGSTTK